MLTMRATILLPEQLSLFEIACAIELFALPRPEFSSWYTTRVVSYENAPINGLCNTQFVCEHINRLPECELLVIPCYPVENTAVNEVMAEDILQHVQKGGRVISFCSGTFLLAELGLLEGRIATTHWQYAATFQSRYPHIPFKDDILYVYDGTLGCSAGSAAGIDLGIEVIRQDFGYAVANSVARRLVLPAHRNGGQSQFVSPATPNTLSSLSSALEWAVTHLADHPTVEDMAQKAHMTRRTFDRHFIKQFNMTPLNWLQDRKIETAQRLLETSDFNLDRIAELSGYKSAITLRHNFKQRLTISPIEYREQFKQA
ncbi:helix-turn-helix domain-containing protein [Aestuariibacter sp. AA17]|uniref:Helix-turn-helix domain-containing protein n=1 Tax=Fluctibacter corallii TaxID=2984329 RepID=A0ABT3A735_9ALTE|nr:helix-turn-helix domain-containing protein [Aestuariibacter sp. AA17]MCV2884490.1 helix-turn-helix domain-containing protein [Aestuariibacter sp. AA17]